MLVEIILGKETGDAALAGALDYVRAIRKTPIVVNDSRGFYTSRVVGTYMREGHLMLAEGVPAAMIENVGRMAGMPVGPLALNDEVAVDLAWKILKATEADLGPDAIDPRQKALLEEMVEKRGRYGRKNGKGFYDYPQNGPKRLWPRACRSAADQARSRHDRRRRAQSSGCWRSRRSKSARCIEEGVVTDMREADVGSILGFGFAPFTGGTISYIDGMGTKAFVELCNRLAKHYGDRFKPGKLLLDMAKTGETFYRRFPPAEARRPPLSRRRSRIALCRAPCVRSRPFSPGPCMARDQVDLTPIERRDELVDWIAQGVKPKSQFRIGTEHEKFAFTLEGHRPVPYEGRRGIRALLEGMQHLLGWQPIMEGPTHHRPVRRHRRRRDFARARRSVRAVRRASRNRAPDLERADGASRAGARSGGSRCASAFSASA